MQNIMTTGVMSWMLGAKAWFWSDDFWLPPGVSWSDIEPTEQNKYPEFNVMYMPILYAGLFILIRIAFEWLIARPLGRALGLEDPGSELPNIFKRIYRKFRRWYRPGDSPSKANGSILATRRRTISNSGVFRPIVIPKSKLDKFCECTWRFFFYTSVFTFGLWALWDKSWFTDSANCFIGYPFHAVNEEIKWYYMAESAFYWSLMISQFTDVHRKDFEMMFIHHVATLSLMWFSWSTNYVRFGSLIMVIHDAADIWLESAKMLKYLDYKLLCDIFFAIFAIVWFVTRCGVLPYALVYAAMIEAPSLIVWYPVYFFFNGLILVLQVLHAIWSWMILKVVYTTIVYGEIDDVRSDDDDDVELPNDD